MREFSIILILILSIFCVALNTNSTLYMVYSVA